MPIYAGSQLVSPLIFDGVGKILKENYDIQPSITTNPDPLQIEWDEYKAPFVIEEQSFQGVSAIRVRKVGAWIDSKITSDNIREGITIFGVSGNVKELVPQANVNVKSTSSTQYVHPSSGFNGIQQVTVQPLELQTITGVNPSGSSQTITKSYGYDGINSVQINPVSASVDSNIKPENIKKNVYILGVKGEYDNSTTPVVQSLDVTPTTSAQIINTPTGVDGFNRVNVAAVTADIDQNIKASNIKRGISILGVDGAYVIENLQSKSVTPSKNQLDITFDDGYEGLSNVIIAGVTSSIDSNIKPENIKKDVEILGVTGELEEGIQDGDIQDPVTVSPSTSSVIVKPEGDYKALSQVNVEGVTASIDPNILAENIKKNISILNVLGTYEGGNHFQTDKEVTPSTVDQNITNDAGYDALLNVIVKAVTASIDPNILPKNIRNNISILGVTGTFEGGSTKWFDFDNISGIGFVSKNMDGGGTKQLSPDIEDNEYKLEALYETPEGVIPVDINATLFNVVYGLDDETVTDPTIYQSYIYFTDGNFYDSKFKLVRIPNQISYLYPYENDKFINGLLLNDDDTGLEKTYKLYVLTDSTYEQDPKPVLVDGNISQNMYPTGIRESITKYGNINISDEKIASNFSSTNYIKTIPSQFTQYTPSANSWEMMFKIKHTENTSAYQNIWCQGASYSTKLFIATDNKLSVDLSNSSSSVDIGSIKGTTVLTSNTIYYIKLIFTGTEYILYSSTDGENWITEGNVSSSTKISDRGLNAIGCNINDGSNYKEFKGQIYLNDSYIKINDEMWWQYTVSEEPLFDGHRYVRDIVTPAHVRFEPKLILDNDLETNWVLRDRKGIEYKVNVNSGDQPLTVDVSAWDRDYGEEDQETQVDKLLLNGKVEDNDYTLDTNTKQLVANKNVVCLNNFQKQNQSYYYFKITPTSYGSSGNYYCFAWIDNILGLYLYSNGSSFYPAWVYNWTSSTGGNLTYYGYSLYTNTTYYFRVYVNGTTTTFSYSTNGTSWTQLDSRSSSYTNPTNDKNLILYSNTSSTKNIFNTEGCYIEKNGEKIWELGKNVKAPITSHDIIPLTRDLLFYDIDALASPEYNYHGNLVNYIDEGTEVTMPMYRTHYHNDEQYLIEDFVQPILSSNGTMGGTTFAVAQDSNYDSSHLPWRAFDGITDYNDSYRTITASGYPHWIAFYNPEPIKVTKITIYNGYGSESPNNWQFQYSDDNSTWTTITSGTNTNKNNGGMWSFDVDVDEPHKYYRLYASDSGASYLSLMEMKIEGKALTPKIDEDIYVFSPDDTFTDGIKFSNTEYVDTVTIPAHNLFTWDKNLEEWITYTLMNLTIEVNDETEEFLIEESK